MSIRLLIVDDHRMIRDALTDLFAATVDIDTVGQCADGSEVVSAVQRHRPDVVLMDLMMPVMDGLTAARATLDHHPQLPIVILTGGLTAASVREARDLGIAGYLLKDGDPADFPDHVRAVAAGGTAWNPIAMALLQEESDPAPDPPRPSLGPHYSDGCPSRLH